MLTEAQPARAADAITRSNLDSLLASDFFMWSTGIEDTFITDPHRKTARALDEYALTQHYAKWREDIGLMAQLSVRYARYGIPWHLIEPERDRFDFTWPDQTFELMLELGIQPIVDLVHYGTPPWLVSGFGNPEYPARVAEYAKQIAERYKGRVFWYTPLNEPRITAYYCGRLGWWPPYGRSWRGFVQVMISVCKGIVLTQRALRKVDPEIVCAHVDATDLYHSLDPRTDAAAELRQNLVFLALDLVSGRVDDRHPLRGWLLKHRAEDLDWFLSEPVELDVVGVNLYPMFSDKVVLPTSTGTRVRLRYGSADLITRLGAMYYERYERPIWISETAAVGRRREAWLRDSLDAVKGLRAGGVPVFGYTWWPLFALVAWGYREKDLAFERYLVQMGLWNLQVAPDGDLRRIPTKLVQSYRQVSLAGCERVGLLGGRS